MQPHRTRRGGPYRGLPDKRSDAQPLAIGGNYDGTYFVLVELHFPALASGYHHTVLYTVCAAQRKTQKEPRSAQAPERGKSVRAGGNAGGTIAGPVNVAVRATPCKQIRR